MANIDVNIDKILNLPKIQRIGIIAGVAVIILGLYGFLIYRGQAQELDDRNVVLTKKQQELNEQRVVLNDLPRFRKETEEMKKKRQVALKQLPDKKEIDKLLQDISYHAVESGLEVLLFKPQKEIKKNFYAEIPVDIKLSGAYHDQAIFFDKIANLQRIVNISNLVIDKPKEIDGRNVLQVSCKVKTYKFIEEKPGEKGKKEEKKKK
ncbi:MAG: type 4a pilus biogenesis protein PilO [Deltaproteobacteria bacterium]|jgi:type IV pilus assembly protein PilO|nr:type 4a pilus biogenesis protein PilO [Deltaproteobacteria bacterium]